MNKTYCDICGKEFTCRIIRITKDVEIFTTLLCRREVYIKDICNDCSLEIKKYLDELQNFHKNGKSHFVIENETGN